ncbi:hypothetical protein PVAND_005665 [Polypedilum vanderplanki]|uniref:Uncharacterized protein n=1 Tax=Polypedilum vanderplanki TaxID=319348 RepID=A0A9J6C168_POLVA|nr:hypothetical protein PVAND_005665 [Polypedilum vanderplanki]
MRGFSSRIPMPGSSSTQSSTPTQSQNNQKFVTPKTKLAPTKLTRPTDIPLSNFVRPAIVTQKITQITKSSLSNLTSRILTRQFSANNEQQQKSTEMSSQSKELQEMQNKTHDVHENDQMLIDETIDLVGSDDNVNRYASKESIQNHLQQQSIINPPPNATFDINRRDGTFIKSPTRGPSAIGSVNSLPDTKETPTNSAKRAVSKSRDSLNSIQVSNQTRVIHLRKSGNDFDGSSLSLTKSPDWGSEDMLIDSPIDMNGCVFNSTLITEERLVEVTAMRPFFNNDTFINATQLLCMTPVDKSNNNKPQAMEVDECDATITNVPMRINDNTQVDPQKRYSFGLDITECTLDCSIELCDISMSSTMLKTSPVEKQGSFDVDESLGILTPDQMKEFLDSTNTNHTNNLELPLIPGHKLSLQCRIDQTPSPEELPLDPVGVKMEEIIQQPIQQQISTSVSSHQEISVSQAESDPKTDMTKSATSKVSNSIITSITSITSLDTGYIGDGENSRPASRGAADQSPSKVPRNEQPPNWNQVAQPQQQAAAAVHRQRQDPMTDSDFFTESDADDIFHQRENQRRAQVIDGQLYGPMLQGANVIFQQQPQESDSCMESSGVFTDVENRGDDELLNRLAENAQHHANDMSPDLSSDTITSSGTACSQKKLHTTTPSPTQQHHHNHHSIDRPREFINETSSSICSMMMDECAAINETNVGETINLISDASLGSTKLCVEDAEVNVCDTNNRNNISSSSKKTVTSVSAKKTIGSSRKTHKNETNFGLKKHEMSSRGSSTIKTNDKTQSSAKKNLNGKWEPVMNKIAENKNVKKNFDNVKSKVTCGAVKRTITTGSLKTPPSDDHSIVSTESTGAIAKRNAGVKDSSSSGNKRGRAFSKDSQESSQSDLSLNGASTASPKIIKSSATREYKI